MGWIVFFFEIGPHAEVPIVPGPYRYVATATHQPGSQATAVHQPGSVATGVV